MSDIVTNLNKLKMNISSSAQRSGRTADDVRLVLVSKTIASDRIMEAVGVGQVDLGENKVQEGLRKSKELVGQNIKWSMIGHLQSNKVKDALDFANEVQSLDRLSLAVALEKRLQSLGRSLDVLVQVNTSAEASKFGLTPEAVPQFLKELSSFDSLRPKGFMTLATFTHNEAEVRRCFRLLREIRNRAINDSPQGHLLQDLSMGMSGDYEWAIEEGATIVRVGQAVFGVRLSAAEYWPGAAGT